MCMSQLVLRCWCLLLASIVVAQARYDDLIPPSKLRPADPSRFYPELVTLHDEELAEIRSILSNDLNRPDIAGAVTKQLLGKLPMDGNYFAKFLDAPSEVVQEWALRTMGGYGGDKAAAVPVLLRIVSDSKKSDAQRALAARVIGTTGMNSQSVSVLVGRLDDASKELRVILLETIASGGRAGFGFVPVLKGYLNVPEGSVQFHAFRTIQHIDRDDRADSGEHYASARLLWRGDTKANLAVSVLQQSDVPKYLACVALLNLAAGTDDPRAAELVLRRTGDHDEFVAKLAQSVLKQIRLDASTLTQGVLNTNATIRRNSLAQLRELGTAATAATDALVALLRRAASEGASLREVGASLDVIRNIGTNGSAAAEILVQLLDEDSPIYRNVERHEVHRLRGFLLATLGATGVPKTAMPAIVSALANSDRRAAIEFAGAARAAAALGPQARETIPFLLRALTERLDEDFIAFDRFDSHGIPGAEFTTCQIEALRALAAIGSSDETTVQVVRAFSQQSWPELDGTNLFRRIPNLRMEATKTLAAIEVSR